MSFASSLGGLSKLLLCFLLDCSNVDATNSNAGHIQERAAELAIWLGKSRDQGDGSRRATVRIVAESQNHRQKGKEDQQMERADFWFLDSYDETTEQQSCHETTVMVVSAVSAAIAHSAFNSTPSNARTINGAM
jgi:hypothetical protein